MQYRNSNVTNLASKQRGVFSIELVIILIGFSLLLVFTMDVVTKQTAKGKLDRLAYSVVGILKERTQIFDSSQVLSRSEATMAYELVSNSLNNTMNSYESSRLGVLIEQQRFTSDQRPTGANIFRLGEYNCEPVERLNSKQELAPVTSFGNKLSLYQVTLCYRTDNVFGGLVGETWELTRATAISVGR